MPLELIIFLVVLLFFSPALFNGFFPESERKKFRDWTHRYDQHKIELLRDIQGMPKGIYVVDHLVHEGNSLDFRYGGIKKEAYNYTNNPEFKYLGKLGETIKEVKKEKKKSMPRIIKFAFYIMILMLCWKFVMNVDGIVLFLTKRFIGGL